MLPILFTIGPVKIYTFGVFLLLAFLWSLFFVWKNIKLTSEKEEVIFDGIFLSLLFGLFFSRLVYVILNFSSFGFDPLKFILINGFPGLSLFGFIFGSFLALFLFFYSKKVNWLMIFDYLITPIFVALTIGKLGSFLAGVDVGGRTNFILSAEYLGLEGKRHLVGLYEAIFFFLACFFSYQILLLVRRQILPKGFNFYFFLFYFGLINLLLDNLKENHLYFVGGSLNYFLSLILVFVFGVYFIFYFLRRQETKDFLKVFLSQLKFSILFYEQKNIQKHPGKTSKSAFEKGEGIKKKN